MEELIESSDYALAQKWAIEVAGEPNQAQLIIPEDRFIKPLKMLSSFNIGPSWQTRAPISYFQMNFSIA